MAALMAIGAATVGWFFAAAALFFNPPVDGLYRSQENHPAVRSLPQSPSTIGKILLAIIAQVVLWAGVFVLVADALPIDLLSRGLVFGGVIIAMKLVPRDIDRILLTTYPTKRLAIEFVIGVVCAFVVSYAFAWLF